MSRFAPPGEAGLKCPVCGKPAADPADGERSRTPRPFCSERCKLVDLGRWLDGAYQIPAEDDDRDESDPPPVGHD